MKKQLIRVVALTGLAGLVLSGCSSQTADGGAGSSSDISGELTMLTPLFASDSAKEAFDESLAGFREQYPEVTLTVDYTDYGKLGEKITSGLAGGLLPDIVQIGVGWIPPLASKGVLAPLNELGFTPEALEADFPEAAVQASQWDGNVYAVPFVTQGLIGVYNKAAFEAAGLDPEAPPSTWDELRDAAVMTTERDGGGSLTQAGFTAVTDNLRQNFTGFLAAQGGSQFNDDGTKATFNSAEGVDALEFLDSLVNDDKVVDVGFESGAPQHPIVSGKAAMALYGAYLPCDDPEIITPEICEQLGYFAIPGETTSDPGSVVLGGTLSSITTGAKNPEAAAALVKYMTENPEVAFSTTASTYTFPSTMSSWTDPRVADNAASAAFIALIDDAAFEGGPTTWLDTRNDFGPALESVIVGGADAQSALDDLAAKADAAIAAAE
ncbi:ABC transporter substrate-binding protein [Microbacterium invictum]|uniref:ABC transporter substrate-binding protein n=1 Tax=Microbacterium invictum TaxID=515415 RepID=A0ABZ0VEW2_9MICO|nr:ABC transporter substrate-binding protein [Microbacterium invictum]WQB70695.1 ABC transporter substrate-binding protein [Microbacterium invictum]